MSASTRRPLTLDDPLAAGPANLQESPAPTSAPQRQQRPAARSPAPLSDRSNTAREPVSDSRPASIPTATREWRDWTGRTRVTSFRLPDELLDELARSTARLGLPIGQTIVAALTSLLDEDDAIVIERVDRAAQTLRRGKRAARRRQSPSDAPTHMFESAGPSRELIP